MAEAGVELGRGPGASAAAPGSRPAQRFRRPVRALRVPPWSIITAAVLLTAILGRFVADGRIKYGLGIALAVRLRAGGVHEPSRGVLDLGRGPVLRAALGAGLRTQRDECPHRPGLDRRLPGRAGAAAAPGASTAGSIGAILLLCVWITLSAAWADKPGTAGTEAAYWWMAAFAFIITLTTIRSPRHVSYIALAFVAGAVISVAIGLATGGLSPSAVSSSQTAIRGPAHRGRGRPQPAGGRVRGGAVPDARDVQRLRAPDHADLADAGLPFRAVGFFATESRGGLLALGAATIVALFIAPRQRRRIAALAAMVGVACVGLLVSSPGAIHRITDLSGGSSGRSDLWRVGWEVFKSHPLIGVGAGNFVVVESALRPAARRDLPDPVHHRDPRDRPQHLPAAARRDRDHRPGGLSGGGGDQPVGVVRGDPMLRGDRQPGLRRPHPRGRAGVDRHARRAVLHHRRRRCAPVGAARARPVLLGVARRMRDDPASAITVAARRPVRRGRARSRPAVGSAVR